MTKTVRLSNGVRVVMEAMPQVRSVSFGIWVRNGSRNEMPRENGISHFIEHMLFKGTKERTAAEIADHMDAIGGQLNAYTAKEYTAYYTRVLDSHFDTALDVLADMFFCSQFAGDEIAKERNVILEEIAMYEDTPEDLVHDLLQASLWRGDSLGAPILGTEESINAFDHAMLKAYFTDHYCPENTVLAIAGNFDEAAVIEKFEERFKAFPRSAYSFPSFETDYQPCFVKKEKDIEQLHLCMSFPGLPLGSELTYDMAVLNTLFGGGMSSRLFQNIREKNGLVYSIYSYGTGYTGTGIMTVYAALNPAQMKEAVKLIIQETQRMCCEPIDGQTLRNTKEQLKSNYMLGLESTSSVMSSIGKAELMLGRVLSPDEMIARIEAVTVDSIYALSQSIFDLEQVSMSAVGKVQDLVWEEVLGYVK